MNKINAFIQKYPFALPLALFLLLHVVLLNINQVEWGDSYRILRASEFLREDLSYPLDEKRPPLFSLVLATWPQNVDPVLWARIVMLVISTASFYVFYKILKLLPQTQNKTTQNIALLLFALNPVYLYWSIRVMADIPLSFLVLLSIYLVILYKNSLSPIKTFAIGLLVGLSILTRFEGYILFGSIALGIFYDTGLSTMDISLSAFWQRLRQKFTLVLTFAFGVFVLISPYLLYRNPFESSYFQEPSSRTYDYQMLVIYLLSLLFLFGFTSATFFFTKHKEGLKSYFLSNIAITSFILVELLLILVWPAAVPRLFVQIIPLLVIPLAFSIVHYFKLDQTPMHKKLEHIKSKIPLLNKTQINYMDLSLLGVLLGVYILGQYSLNLQFLVLVKPIFAIIVLLEALMIISIVRKKFSPFVLLLTISMFLWSFATIYIHKDIYNSVKEASVYFSENLNGNLLHNDPNSIVEWYSNAQNIEYNFGIIHAQDEELLNMIQGYDYVIVTNEANLSFDAQNYTRDELVDVKIFSQYANGAEFVTKILKVQTESPK